MKAVRFHTHGGPEVLRYEDAPEPVARPGEALVRVRACALNHVDLWQRRGLEHTAPTLPHISGADVAGEIVDAPGGEITAGRRVLVQPGLSCGRCDACLAGVDNECPYYDIVGARSDGGYAELLRVPVQNLVALPETIGFVEAAAFPVSFLTAWHMLMTRAHLVAGEDVLVIAAGSGVGQAAIQIAWLHGARVFATAGSEEKLAKARQMGAYEAFNHHTQDVAAEVRRHTSGHGVAVVVEHAGQATWDRSVACLKPGGRLVICGATTGSDARIDLQLLSSRQHALLGSFMGAKSELLRAMQFFSAGQLRPVIDSTYPLRDAAEAQRRLERGAAFGKVVLEVP